MNRILEKLKTLNNETEESEVMQTILEVISMTKLCIKMEDLKQFLPEKQYEELYKEMKRIIEKIYRSFLGSYEDEKRNNTENLMNAEEFHIVKQQGEFYISHEYLQNESFLVINLEEISMAKLLGVSENVMQREKNNDDSKSKEDKKPKTKNIVELLDVAIKAIEPFEKLTEKSILEKTKMELKAKLKKITEIPETDAMQVVLEVMSMTKSWMKLEDLKHFLPEGQCDLISKTIKIDYLGYGYTENEIQTNLAKERVVVEKNKQGQFYIKRFLGNDLDDKEFSIINLEKILVANFMKEAREAMQEHRKYDKFYANQYLSQQEVPEILDETIDALDLLVKSVKKERNIEEKQESNTLVDNIKNAIKSGKTKIRFSEFWPFNQMYAEKKGKEMIESSNNELEEEKK